MTFPFLTKIRFFSITAFMAIVVLSCARLPVYEPKQVSDGDISKISDLRFYDKKSKVKYDIFRDDENIYVSFIVADYYSQVKILRFGLTLWIDPNNKKKKDMGIEFPIKEELQRPSQQQRAGMKPGAGMTGGQNMAQLHTMFDLSEKNNLLIGFDGEGSKREIYPEREKCDVYAKIFFDGSNRLVYNAVIPVKYVMQGEGAKNDNFTIGIESGHLDMSSAGMGKGMRPGGGMPGGGRPGGGMGGGMGGGGGRGGMRMSGGGRPQMSQLTDPLKLWFSVSLKDI